MSQLNINDYNTLVRKQAANCHVVHKVSTCLYRHNKTGKYYYTIGGKVLNCTNAQDGEEMILYSDGIRVYCRELKEFNSKFSIVNV